MTEQEWLNCRETGPMLRYLELEKVPTCRKLRLFGLACCRRIEHLLIHQPSRECLDLAERYGDKLANATDLQTCHGKSSAFFQHLGTADNRMESATKCAYTAADWLSIEDERFHSEDGYRAAAASYIARAAADAVFYATCDSENTDELWNQRHFEGLPTSADSIWAAEEEAQCKLLRDIIGDPFRPVSLDRSCLDPAVTIVAALAYEERALPSGEIDAVRLAGLADLLQQGGRGDAEILNHLRGPGPHVRGCWAVDLLLGKE